MHGPRPDLVVPSSLWQAVRAGADVTDREKRWPAEQLRLCAEAGLLRWFLPNELGGFAAPQTEILRMLSRLATNCLTTAFTLTQPAGMLARLAACENDELTRRLLPDLLAGRKYGAVGIAQLTTSRRHVARPVMQARESPGGYVLDGVIPWVTGGAHAAWIVTGAQLDDGRQLLGVLPTDLPGVVVEPAVDLTGLSATSTGPVRCEGVLLKREWLIAPVTTDVLRHGKGAGTGGLQTSALALGTAAAAIEFLEDESRRRTELEPIARRLRDRRTQLERDLMSVAGGDSSSPNSATPDDVRRRANDLALRSSQAALAAAKGSGYVVGHPAGRWCREALFFLVWSCPQPVVTATLCDLAQIDV